MKTKQSYHIPLTKTSNTKIRLNILAGSSTATPDVDGKTGDFGYGVRERNDIGVD